MEYNNEYDYEINTWSSGRSAGQFPSSSTFSLPVCKEIAPTAARYSSGVINFALKLDLSCSLLNFKLLYRGEELGGDGRK